MLIVRDRKVLQAYQLLKSRMTKTLALTEEDMRKYLEKSAHCLGIVKRKFYKVNQFGVPQKEGMENGGSGRQLYDVDTALAFDYKEIQQQFAVYLTSDTSAMTDEEIAENEAEKQRNTPSQSELPF